MKRRICLAFTAALLAPLPAAAHHGWAGQDNSKVTVVEGPIQAVRYRNPHGEIEVTGPDKQRWLVTLAPIARMQSRGVTESVLKVGQVVRIEGARNLDQSRNEVKANSITIAGKTTSLR
jgi:hypothetical protein